MNEAFFNESVVVADEFIKTIAIIDDEPDFSNGSESDHVLLANQVIKTFAKTGKSCTVFKIQTNEEKNDILTLIRSTDVCILDWKLSLALENVNEISKEEGEDDVDDTAGRGRHAIELLKEILSENSNSPKLLLIYTAERECKPIFDAVKGLFDDDISFNEDDLYIQNLNYRIIIRFKPTLKDSIDIGLKSKCIDYVQLPDLISREFANVTNGLISNVALKAITILRKNTNKLLREYTKELDPAYLAHRAM